MKWFEVFQALQAVVMLIATALLLSFRLGGKSRQVFAAPAELNRRMSALEERMKEAGEKSSRLATSVQAQGGHIDDLRDRVAEDHERIRNLNEYVNAMPGKLQDTFVTRREGETLVRESVTDRQRLQREIENIWSVMRKGNEP